MALYFLLSVEAGSFDQSGARRIEARAIFVFKLISSRRPQPAHSISQSRVGLGSRVPNLDISSN